MLTFKPLLAAQVTSILKHVPRLGVQSPERAFSRLVRRPGNFHEAVVEAERVTDRILPALLVLPVVWEQVHDELIDFGQSQHFGIGLLDGHCDQADVRVRRLCMRIAAPIRLIGTCSLQEG